MLCNPVNPISLPSAAMSSKLIYYTVQEMGQLALLLCICYVMAPTTGTISSKRFRKHENYRQTGAVKLSTSVDSVVQCGRLCGEDDKCESYNIVQQNGSMQCEINDADNYPVMDFADVRSSHYSKPSFSYGK